MRPSTRNGAADGGPPRPTERSRLEWGLLGSALLLALALVAALAWGGTSWAIDRSLSAFASAGAPGGSLDGLRSWWLERNADLLEAASADASPVEFEIFPGEPLPEVAARLEAQGLIRDATAFRSLARLRGLDTQVQAGQHALRRDMPAEELLNALLVAPGEQLRVTIPEGWRLEELAALLDRLGIATRVDLIARASAPAPQRWPLLASLPDGASLEGYLFPDTYDFEPAAGADAVIDRLLTTLEARLTPEMRARAEAAGLSIHELMTLASIVEREAVLPEERARIARVYLNRLAEPPYILNADPTIQYALGYQPEQQSWWKRPLLYADLEIDSPYNSYRRPGLPPGPIASAGLEAIRAVLEPEPGSWQYFVANDVACDGSHVFADTLEAHNANVATYQTGACGR
ncbi:MAG: endolytic transglycosylase MltG [Caldilineae bacterium]|nr:endolytic transglycosylase MltG [Caldilineae bacterium]